MTIADGTGHPPTSPPATTAVAPAVVAHLRARGLLHDRDVVERGVRVLDLSRSHPVALVEIAAEPAYVVKELAAEDVQGSGSRESAAYALADGTPELRRIVPGWHGPDADGRWLVLDAVTADSAADRLARDGATDARWTSSLGTALGRWHAAATDAAAFLPARPWILDAVSSPRPAFLDSNEGARRFLSDAGQRLDVERLLGQAEASWSQETVVHGDLRLDNCLVSDDADTAILIDWETAGWGDPAWDAAAIVQELVTTCGASDLGGAARLVAGAVRSFLAAHTDAYGRPVTDRIGIQAAARVLQRAVQVASWDPAGRSPETDRLVALAGELAASEHAWWEYR